MELFYQILSLVGAGLIIWIMHRTIKNNKAAFSRDNIQKSLSSLGVLALILIAFVGLLILILRQ
jgi:hypothetical protein